MKKILVATEKPFAKVAVEKIKAAFAGGDYDIVLLEKYTDVEELKAAIADADALIFRSDKITLRCWMLPRT